MARAGLSILSAPYDAKKYTQQKSYFAQTLMQHVTLKNWLIDFFSISLYSDISIDQLRAVGNTVSDLTGPRFEPQTFHSRDEHDTTQPTSS